MTNFSQRLLAAIKAGGLEPTAYSGRYMQGELCIGVDCESSYRAVMSIVSHGDFTPEERLEVIDQMRLDSKGLDFVVYWPEAGYVA